MAQEAHANIVSPASHVSESLMLFRRPSFVSDLNRFALHYRASARICHGRRARKVGAARR
jgi:hypothetical protein